MNGRLYRLMADTAKEVPAVCDRMDLVTEVHIAGGHVGV